MRSLDYPSDHSHPPDSLRNPSLGMVRIAVAGVSCPACRDRPDREVVRPDCQRCEVRLIRLKMPLRKPRQKTIRHRATPAESSPKHPLVHPSVQITVCEFDIQAPNHSRSPTWLSQRFPPAPPPDACSPSRLEPKSLSLLKSNLVLSSKGRRGPLQMAMECCMRVK